MINMGGKNMAWGVWFLPSWGCLLVCWNGLCILASLCWFCVALGLVPYGLAEVAFCCCLLPCWGFVWSGEVLSPMSRLFSLMEMLYGSSMYAYYHMVLMLVQGSLFPLIVCSREPVPSDFCSASLSYVLFKGLCSLFLVLLVSSVFLIHIILTFDIKKFNNCESLCSVIERLYCALI